MPASNKTAIGLAKRSHMEGPQQTSLEKVLLKRDETWRPGYSLPQSGDYFGVQGAYHQTREANVLTSTSSSIHTICEDARGITNSFGNGDAEDIVHNPAVECAGENTTIIHQRLGRDKLESSVLHRSIDRDSKRKAKSRHDPKHWSSAQEPDLSPIAQSTRSVTPRTGWLHLGWLDFKGLTLTAPVDSKSAPQARTQQENDVCLIQIDSGVPLLGHDAQIVTSLTDPTQRTASSDTIVHTPLRRGSPNISPSALELFEQGIIIGPHPCQRVHCQPTLVNNNTASPEAHLTKRLSTLPQSHQDNFNKGSFGSRKLSFLGQNPRDRGDPGETPGRVFETPGSPLKERTEQIKLPSILAMSWQGKDNVERNQVMTSRKSHTHCLKTPSPSLQRDQSGMDRTDPSQQEPASDNILIENPLGEQQPERRINSISPMGVNHMWNSEQSMHRQTHSNSRAEFSVTTGQKDAEATVTSFLSNRRVARKRPSIPRRLIPRLPVSPIGDPKSQDGSHGIVSKSTDQTKGFWCLTSKTSFQGPEKDNSEPLLGWQNEIGIPVECAFTPITITTGYDHGQSRSSSDIEKGTDSKLSENQMSHNMSNTAFNPPALVPVPFTMPDGASFNPLASSYTLPQTEARTVSI